jgi:hypothetical protein
LSSLLLSRNVKVKIYKTISLPVVLYVCENRVLRRIFGPKRDGIRGEWRKFNSEELHILCLSPDIIRQIKSKRMKWAGHVARMGEERGKCTGFWWESPKEGDHSENQGVDGRMGSEWILGRLAGGVWIGFN